MPSPEPFVAAVASSRTKRNRRAGAFILAFCLILAVAITLLVPMIVDGAQPGKANPTGAVQMQAYVAPAAPESKEVVVELDSFEALVEQAGFTPALPLTLPEGAAVKAFRLINGQIAEIEFKADKSDFKLRVSPGREDISGVTKSYAVTFSEEAAGVTRSYSGVSDTLLNLCVWSSQNNCYAIVSSNGIDADVMRSIAESLV